MEHFSRLNGYCKLASKPVVDRTYGNYIKRMIELGLRKAERKEDERITG